MKFNKTGAGCWEGFAGDHRIILCLDDDIHKYNYSIYNSEGVVQTAKYDFNTKNKAVKDIEAWCEKNLRKEKYMRDGELEENPSLFPEEDGYQQGCKTCGSEECVCDNVKITITKTKRKEKLPEQPKNTQLKCALWFIEKMGDVKTAKKVFNAACTAMKELEK